MERSAIRDTPCGGSYSRIPLRSMRATNRSPSRPHADGTHIGWRWVIGTHIREDHVEILRITPLTIFLYRTINTLPRPLEGRLSRGVAKGGTEEGVSWRYATPPSWPVRAVEPVLVGAAPCGRASQARTRVVPGLRPSGITTGAQGACLSVARMPAKRGPELVGIRPALAGPRQNAADGAPRGGCARKRSQRYQDWPASFGAPSPSFI